MMSEKDRTTQHSSTGVGGSNNPAANPGQDKPGGKRPDDRAHDVGGIQLAERLGQVPILREVAGE